MVFKMRCDVLTIFPDIIRAYLNESILKRAKEKNLLDVKVYDLRDFTTDRHRKVDDYPFGGGAGMVLKPEPVFKAVEFLKGDGERRRVVLLSPQGRVFTQSVAEEFSRSKERFVFICGRYEGIDERVRLALIDDEISIGDYVITGGELAALIIIDAATRLMPGALGDERSAEEESFTSQLLEYPHYTRPRDFRGMKVPEVLLSGNHKEIWLWRRREAIRRTLKTRPDLLERIELSELDRKILSEIREERLL
jgi:tRNA (guanine37-N1)-methyltransferase